MRIIIVAAGGAVLMAVPPAAVRAADDASQPTVIVQRVGRACFANLVNASGYVMPRTPGVVMFNAPKFRITEVLVKEGDTIKRGDPVASAVAIGQTQVPGQPQGQPQAQGQHAANTSSAGLTIRSIVAGTVIKRNASVGQLTSANSDPLFTVAVDGILEVGADILNVHAPALQVGDVVRVILPDGKTVPARVRLAPVRIDRQSQFGQARISFDANAPRSVGQFVRVAVETGRSCGVGVPRAALSQSSEGPRVQLVIRGTIVTRTLRLGLLNDTDAEVVSGVREGDFVVADAGTSLRDGDRVRPVSSDLQDAE